MVILKNQSKIVAETAGIRLYDLSYFKMSK